MNQPSRGPSGIRFTEEMKGHVSFGQRYYERGAREGRETGTRLMFHLTIAVEDLNRFAADGQRAASARGWVECEALGGRLPVEEGFFNLLVDHGDPGRKRMLYRLYFRYGVGHPLTLVGFKFVGAGSGVRVWRDTTPLYTRVVRGHTEEGDDPGSETVASGILRLRPPGFLKQLATFRADGDSPRARAAAIGRFDALFLGGLWQVYGRRFVGARNSAATAVASARRKLGWWKAR